MFSGGGFGAAGAVQAGGVPVLSADTWRIAVDTYKANFPQSIAKCCDLTSVSPSDFGIDKSGVDLLLASPECTSHSLARGARPPDERSRETALVVPHWVEALSPQWIVLENVARLANWEGHTGLMRSLCRLGYQLEQHILNAADFGAPQSRKRLFVVGKRGDQPPQLALEPYLLARSKSANDVIQWDRWRMSPLYKPGRAKATLERAGRAIAALGRGKPFIIVYYGSDGAGGWQRTDVPLRTITTLDRFAVVRWIDDVPFMRMLQPQELAVAMGAPNHLLPVGTRRDKVKLCGNGVCAPVTEALFRAIIAQTSVSAWAA
ncbi:DNA cytosine methyltransferase [Algiphilus sp.]|uniref:DNA cytosine methyltransferase n=1 Tax=Algiphilus sp. TaxID=1872431 RepID=UPI003BA87F08